MISKIETRECTHYCVIQPVVFVYRLVKECLLLDCRLSRSQNYSMWDLRNLVLLLWDQALTEHYMHKFKECQ